MFLIPGGTVSRSSSPALPVLPLPPVMSKLSFGIMFTRFVGPGSSTGHRMQ